MRLLACLIVAPQRGYDEPAIPSYAISSFCPTSADGLQIRQRVKAGLKRAVAQGVRLGRPKINSAIQALAWRGAFMPNRLALENNHWFGPEEIAGLTTAFEAASAKLGLVDRSDPTTLALAKLIIELAKAGECEPERLCASALKRLSKPPYLSF
jgi:hypothetical protein